jgi:hypothetical protein
VFYPSCEAPVGSPTWQNFVKQPNGEYHGKVLTAAPQTCAPSQAVVGAALREFTVSNGDAVLEIVLNRSSAASTQATINPDGSVLDSSPFACFGLSHDVDGPSVLPSNFCNVLSREWPAGGYGYSFENEGMADYATDAGLAIGDILRKADLEREFVDWNSHPMVAGALGGAQPQRTLMKSLWNSMRGGTCYGLALSDGLFVTQPWSLPEMVNEDPDSTWNVGSDPSASTLLPKPDVSTPLAYRKQFLRLVGNTFATQFSTEALASIRAQRHAYAVGGMDALRAQLGSVMREGVDLHGSLRSLPFTGFALIVLQALDSPDGAYGHAVLAYSEETLETGALRIDVWDNNFPGQPYQILVSPSGQWTYVDAPYPEVSPGFRPWGSVYSLSGSGGGQFGVLAALPLYTQGGLHLFPDAGSRGSIVDIGSDTEVTGATNADGSPAFLQPVLASSAAHDGALLEYDTDIGHLTVSGPEPTVDVRGSDTYMSLSGDGSVGALEVTEDTGAGSIGARGGAVDLAVARGYQLVSGSGASELVMSEAGAVTAEAGAEGFVKLTVEFNESGDVGSATLFSGAVAPGEKLHFSPAQVTEVEAPSTPGGSGQPPADDPGSPPPASEPSFPTSPPTVHPAPEAQMGCRKGFKRKKFGGKTKCVKAKRKHRPRHH